MKRKYDNDIDFEDVKTNNWKNNSMVGQKHGELTIYKILTEKTKTNNRYILCKCSCGETVKISNNKWGRMKSCGHVHNKYNWRDNSMLGATFKKLTITKIENTKDGNKLYCSCSCGNKTTIWNKHWEETNSCGCINQRNKQHMMSGDKIYKIWKSMKERCENHNNTFYGSKGISYTEEWYKFSNFYKEMRFKWVYAKKKYRKNITPKNYLTIERRDTNKDYCFENCEFIPLSLQGKNRKSTKKFCVINTKSNEKTNEVCAIDFAKANGIKKYKIFIILNGKLPFKYRDWIFIDE